MIDKNKINITIIIENILIKNIIKKISVIIINQDILRTKWIKYKLIQITIIYNKIIILLVNKTQNCPYQMQIR